MVYLSLSKRRERVGISSHWGSGSGTRLARLEWNGDKKKCAHCLSAQLLNL